MYCSHLTLITWIVTFSLKASKRMLTNLHNEMEWPTQTAVFKFRKRDISHNLLSTEICKKDLHTSRCFPLTIEKTPFSSDKNNIFLNRALNLWQNRYREKPRNIIAMKPKRTFILVNAMYLIKELFICGISFSRNRILFKIIH